MIKFHRRYRPGRSFKGCRSAPFVWCRPDDVCGHHSLISLMSVSRSVQLLETELSLWLVLDYGTVCHMTSERVTHLSRFRR